MYAIIIIVSNYIYIYILGLQKQHSEDLWIDSRLYSYAFALDVAKQYLFDQ